MRILQRALRLSPAGDRGRRRGLAGLAVALTLAACGEAAAPVVAPAPAEPPLRMTAARIDVVDLREDRGAPFIEAQLDPGPAAAAAAALRDRFAPADASGAIVFAIETAAVRALPVAASATPAGVASTRYDGAIRLRATLPRLNAPARRAPVPPLSSTRPPARSDAAAPPPAHTRPSPRPPRHAPCPSTTYSRPPVTTSPMAP